MHGMPPTATEVAVQLARELERTKASAEIEKLKRENASLRKQLKAQRKKRK